MVDQIEELEPSTDSEIPQDEEVLSSSAESETEEDLLSVVQDAMQMSTTDEGSQPEETETEEDNEFIASTEDSSDEDESFEDVPFNKHPRFKKLIEERNSYKQGANQYNQIQSFLDQNSVSADEAATGLQIMALMKNNPAEALKALQPYVENLSVVTGSKIPQDIQSKVDDGYLDEDAARELSVSRMEAQRQKQMREQLEQQNAASTEQQNKSYLAQTVTTWEEKTRQSDPDYSLKEAEIDDRVRLLVLDRGRPQTSQEALSMAKEAYDTVSERYTARFKNVRQIKPASGGKISGTPEAAPNSLMEAVQHALTNGAA
jgi:hypothetical protein|tara:strand:+ start:4101 stop:5051 length:951 start_codon:yes stop_codon:yes gene_type:complete